MFRSRRGKPLRLQQRHFEFIAHTLKKYGSSQSMIGNFANELVHTNPMFKIERFLKAAGYYDMPAAVPFHVVKAEADRAKHTAAAIVAAGSPDPAAVFAEALAKMEAKIIEKAAHGVGVLGGTVASKEDPLIAELKKAIAEESKPVVIPEDEWTSADHLLFDDVPF